MKATLLLTLLAGVLHFFPVQGQTLSPDSTLATVYFYRPHSPKGIVFSFSMHHNDSLIGRVRDGSVVIYQCAPGVQEFWSETESRTSIFIDMAPGKTYFVRCRMALGTVAAMPSFRQVGPDEAVTNITPLLQEQNAGESVTELYRRREMAASHNNIDTLRALNNLYERKRKGGRARGAIFAVVGLGGVIASVANSDPSGLAGVSVAALIAITGYTQAAKYKPLNLQKVLNDYANKGILPEKIKSKLKPKDFEW